MNDREKQILYTIIAHYIKTGESVGSRTIEKKYDMGVSSATIRNAMADLEDLGLLSKTHTSSGRVPTIAGYKKYVDEIMNLKYDTGYNDQIKFRNKHLGMILENIGETLSRLSGVTAISLEPSIDNHRLRKVQLISINSKKAYVVCISDLGMVKTANINLFNYTSDDILNKVTEFVNSYIVSTDYNYTLDDLKHFLEKVGELDEGLSEKNDAKLNILNKTSLLLHSDNLEDTVRFFEDDNNIKEIFKSFINNEKYIPYEINIIFGEDLEIPELKNYSLIFTIYEYENQRGVVGIIGPNRMDYKENINIFNYISVVLKCSLNSSKLLKIER